MFEIELKAHVKNRNKVLSELHQISEYVHYVEKNDTYYHLKKLTGEGKDYISTRIRKTVEKADGKEKTVSFLTYKKKEIKISADGTETEVNDEKETEISDFKAVESLLFDIGFTVALKKYKSVEAFKMETEFGHCNLELCTVPPLGDFLEIEILSKDSSKEIVEGASKKIKEIFTICGISEKDIETKYYSEMLKEYNK